MAGIIIDEDGGIHCSEYFLERINTYFFRMVGFVLIISPLAVSMFIFTTKSGLCIPRYDCFLSWCRYFYQFILSE